MPRSNSRYRAVTARCGIAWQRIAVVVFAAVLLAPFATASAAETTTFDVSLDPQTASHPITGRLYVFLQQADGQHNPTTEPRFGPNWFAPEPFFGIDVAKFAPSQICRIDDSADGFPDKLSRLPPGNYRVQAILDQNPNFQNHAKGVGNLYSDVANVAIDPHVPHAIPLVLNHTTEPEPWPASRWAEEVRFPSELLSAFHHREVLHLCGVVLPPSYYDQPQRRYPVVFLIPGFGGDHRRALQYAEHPAEIAPGEEEAIRIFLSGQCKWGHHEYADSATNGPCGQSLVRELIPEIDRRYRTIPDRNARFLYGHSSGGWAALWLMVNYPDVFGGVWAASPDPVDFRDFQGINLYADPPQSMYVDEAGHKRPVARLADHVSLWFDSFAHMDDVLKRGGQLRSFEAVFSPLGADGEPQKLWDRQTGRIDPQVAHQWEKYDLRIVIEQNWPRLQPLLAGRVHIIVGDLDTFYLDGPVRRLAESLKQLGSDAEVTFLPGKDHGNYLDANFYLNLRKQMSDLFQRTAKNQPAQSANR